MLVFLIKALIHTLRLFRLSGGTALPGLIVEKLFPNQIPKLLNVFHKVILVTGTNGKTTTTQMICHLLAKNNVRFITNRSGSNLLRGILSSTIEKVSIFDLDSKRKNYIGVFEIEEASMPIITRLLRPSIIVVTNIFRDQLDAYGEINKTQKYIIKSVLQSENPILVLNGDDKRVSAIGKHSNADKYLVHLNADLHSLVKFEDFYSDQIDYPYYEVQLERFSVDKELRTTFAFSFRGKIFEDELQVPGVHNVINAIYAKVVTYLALNQTKNLQELSLDDFPASFGRGEIVKTKTKSGNEIKTHILLAKNPAGYQLNLHLVGNVHKEADVLFILNDKIADGKDVSWIWDIDFGNFYLNSLIKNIYVTGTRKYDMALRLKYENVNNIQIFSSINKFLDFYHQENKDKVLFVFATYTAMREFREKISAFTKLREIWK